ncbi:hypothetical protein [Halosimplex halobium]|uniref:hypothetical protein n=1 Tax=Halosimplex halobium TaxID=3396618 RepID=UPI003F5797A3
MTDQTQTEFPYAEDEQTIDNAAEIYQWIQTHNLTGAPVTNDLLRLFDPNHSLKAERARFDPDEGTLSIELWNPTWFQAETVEEYYNDCIENSPDGYHFHVEKAGDMPDDRPFDATKAAETIINAEIDIESPPNGVHPDDIRDAFEAVAANITKGAEPTEENLVAETDNYWLARYGPSVTSSIQDTIKNELPDARDDYEHPRNDEYYRIIQNIVTGAGTQYVGTEAVGNDEYTLIHVKPSAYQS